MIAHTWIQITSRPSSSSPVLGRQSTYSNSSLEFEWLAAWSSLDTISSQQFLSNSRFDNNIVGILVSYLLWSVVVQPISAYFLLWPYVLVHLSYCSKWLEYTRLLNTWVCLEWGYPNIGCFIIMWPMKNCVLTFFFRHTQTSYHIDTSHTWKN